MKKGLTLLAIILSIVLIFVLGYLGYGSTMMNVKNEKSIINHLSTDKNNPVDILATKEYEDYFLVLYTDPITLKANENSSCFSCFIKHKSYVNRYKYKGGTTGNQTEIMVAGIELNNEIVQDGGAAYAIANVASNETKCSVFEVDSETGIVISKLDVIDVPKGQPYIIVKEYEKKSRDNMLIVYDGDLNLKDLTEE